MKNKIHWDGAENSLKSGDLDYSFDDADGGRFVIYDESTKNMIVTNYEQAKEFVRFVKFAEAKEDDNTKV